MQWRGAWGLNKLNKRLWEIEDADWLDVGGEIRNLTKGKKKLINLNYSQIYRVENQKFWYGISEPENSTDSFGPKLPD